MSVILLQQSGPERSVEIRNIGFLNQGKLLVLENHYLLPTTSLRIT